MKNFTTLTLGLFISLTSYCQILNESFDDVTTLAGDGWSQINVSTIIGATSWFEGNNTVFRAYSGTPKQYIAANFNNTTGANTISNWLITPVLSLKNGDNISFYTRTSTGSTFPDRLEVRLSDQGASSTAPSNATDVGSYTSLLSSVNPTLAVGGYPETWTQQSISITGLSGQTNARIAFRYFVNDGGPSGTNSSYIGIDEVSINATLGIDDLLLKELTHFYNPKSKILSLESKSALTKITIYTLLGQEVYSNKLEGNSNEVNLSTIMSGVYLIKINDFSNLTKIIKLIIN